jgi:hypothetical protein
MAASTDATGVCVAPCTENSDCSAANGTADGLVCQTESLGMDPTMAGVCTTSCLTDAAICTNGTTCALTDVMLWSETDGDFVAQEAGTCYSPQCTADVLDSCADD